MKIAEQLQLGTRAVRTDLSALPQARMPAILHWDLDHFVVLKAVKGRRLIIHDPNFGERVLSLTEASKHFSGVLLEVYPKAGFHPLQDRAVIRLTSLWTKASGIWGALAQTIALSICLQAATFAGPFYIQLLTDAALQRESSSLLATLALAFAAVAILQSILAAARDWAVQSFGNLFTYQVSANLVGHLLRLPATFFEKRHMGDILSRIGSTSDIQDIVTRGVLSVLIDGLMAVIAIFIMGVYSMTLAALVVATVLSNAILSMIFFPRLRALSGERLIASAHERSHIMESIRAYSTIKLLGAEAEREASWRNLFVNVMNSNIRIAKTKITLEAIQTGLTNLSGIAVLYIAALLVIRHDGFSIGMLFAFFSFRQTFSERASSLLVQATQFRLLGLHLERLGDIVAVEAEEIFLPASHITVSGRITLRDVSFRYGDADPLVLDHVSLDIKEGEFVAITGPSGCGKTTLLRLMLGLTAPNSGLVLLDGHPAEGTLYRQWRSHVSVVAQDDRLMSGSIGNNISFFDPDADGKRIEEAAKLAHIHDDIAKMPCGYHSLVGDMGSSLSEGQKQRILLARALYRRPRILVLDEGTANLDTRTEELIAEVIAALPITRVIVAHRPALVERADRIVVMDLGRAVNNDLKPPRSTPSCQAA